MELNDYFLKPTNKTSKHHQKGELLKPYVFK